jgi:predicted membrane channel-forming protein YqfA (hemolysin III family)
MNGRRLHRSATVTLSVLMAVIGVALIIEAIAGARGSVSLLLVLGLLFVLAGTGRLYLERRRGRGS